MDDIQPQGDAVDDSALDRMRDAPVGTNDPNIVGDVGPTDIPPGMDPPDIDPPLEAQPGEEPPLGDAPSLDPVPSEDGDPLTDVKGPTAYGQTADPAT
jgi:hypothetical protein